MNGSSYSDIYDSTGNGNEPTSETGTVTYEQTGKCGYGVKFDNDPTAGYLNLGASPSYNAEAQGTVEAWIRPVSTDTMNAIHAGWEDIGKA